MFTGLVEETGAILDLKKFNDGLECTIQGKLIIQDLKTNDSVSCSGICLTATEVNNNSFKVQLVNETLMRTTAKYWAKSTILNLERALLPSTRLGGHIVQGHVDTVTTIKNIERLDESAIFTFGIDAVNRKYLVEKGSVCLDGISLTIASIDDRMTFSNDASAQNLAFEQQDGNYLDLSETNPFGEP